MPFDGWRGSVLGSDVEGSSSWVADDDSRLEDDFDALAWVISRDSRGCCDFRCLCIVVVLEPYDKVLAHKIHLTFFGLSASWGFSGFLSNPK